jgi:hypothetical protein
MKANDRQIGGDHYKKAGKTGEEHWDRQYRLFGPGYFVGCATKYIERYKDKNGKADLEKALHFIEKLIEVEYPEPVSMGLPPPPAWANPEYEPLPSFPRPAGLYPNVKPSGWVNFVFEGTTVGESLFTCRICRKEVRCPVEADPGDHHSC